MIKEKKIRLHERIKVFGLVYQSLCLFFVVIGFLLASEQWSKQK